MPSWFISLIYGQNDIPLFGAALRCKTFLCNTYNTYNNSYYSYAFFVVVVLNCFMMTPSYCFKFQIKIIVTSDIKRGSSTKCDENIWMVLIMLLLVLFYLVCYSLLFLIELLLEENWIQWNTLDKISSIRQKKGCVKWWHKARR